MSYIIFEIGNHENSFPNIFGMYELNRQYQFYFESLLFSRFSRLFLNMKSNKILWPVIFSTVFLFFLLVQIQCSYSFIKVAFHLVLIAMKCWTNLCINWSSLSTVCTPSHFVQTCVIRVFALCLPSPVGTI